MPRDVVYEDLLADDLFSYKMQVKFKMLGPVMKNGIGSEQNGA